MKSNTFTAFASAALIAALYSCNTPSVATQTTTSGVVKTETLKQTEIAIHKVLFGTWTAVSVGNLTVDGNDRPYIEFGNDPTNPFLAKCYAYDGCNYLNGTYAITAGGEMHRTHDFISTMRMCPDAKYEMGMTLALNGVSSYVIEKVGLDYLLYLRNAAGETLMTLRRFESDFINGVWSVTSINGQSTDEDLNLQLVFDLNELSIHGNVGCNTLNGKIVVNPDIQNSISFADMLTTRMTCPAIATEQQLINALTTVRTLSPGGNDNKAALRNAEGVEVITLERIDLK